MRSLTDCPATTLVWRRARGSIGFELGAEDGTYASLDFLDESRLLARAETAEGTWTFKHRGLLTPTVTLREEGASENLATFHTHPLRHGTLEFTDGASFDWIWNHPDSTGGVFTDARGGALVRLNPHPGMGHRPHPDPEGCDVLVSLPPMARYRHALLASLGWYLVLFDHLKARDDASADTALRL